MKQTPLFCSDRVDVDISLGMMRNGVGSMSTEDAIMWVPDKAEQELLEEAAATGALVKVTYNQFRFTFCKPWYEVKSVELVE